MSASRTFIGSVVCVDLVGYSKRSVAQQGEIKQAFNKLLMQADRKSTRLNSSHIQKSRMPSSA